MAYDRIATVKPIEENEASDLVAGIYADIKQTKMIDFVPAFCARLQQIPPSSKLYGRA